MYKKNVSVAIVTYDSPHLKTEQVVHKILYKYGASIKVSLLALPFSQRPARNVLIEHRPNQIKSVRTEELAERNNLDFYRISKNQCVSGFDYCLIAGAGILPSNFIAKNKIINAHPGLIPAARGLDSFKWSIYNKIPLGVTLHYIDENIDAGEVITAIRTPIYVDDTLDVLARRHYEIEVDMLSDFIFHLENPNRYSIPNYPAQRRMPIEKEHELIKGFEEYKNKFVNGVLVSSADSLI